MYDVTQRIGWCTVSFAVKLHSHIAVYRHCVQLFYNYWHYILGEVEMYGRIKTVRIKDNMRADTEHTRSSGDTISPLSQAAIAYQKRERDNLKFACMLYMYE